MRVLLLLTATLTALMAQDRPPFYVGGGFGLFDSEIRTMTRKFPWIVTLGWGEPTVALIGAPSLDMDWVHAAGKGNKFDSVGLTYNERILLSDDLYLGVGIGSYYSRIKATSDAGFVYEGNRIYPGGRAMIGSYLGGGRGSAFFTEFGYTYRGEVKGISANNLFWTVGVWF
jgi:hypothetical protein